MDKLQAMRTFVAVVETEGFASAARKLSVSRSVISRVVTELEEYLGVRLLTRTTRVVRVTDAGAVFFEDCRRILAEIENAELAAVGTNTNPRGQLTITAPALFGTMHVIPLANEYMTRFPAVSVNCWFLDRIVNLIDEGVDVAIRIGKLPDSSLKAIPVGKVRRVLCASTAYLEARGTPRRPEDLQDHVLIRTTGLDSAPEWRFWSDGRLLSVAAQPRLITNTNDSAIAAVAAGMGIARVLSYQVAGELAEGVLRVVLPDYEPDAWPVHVVHREGKHVNQKVRAFVDLAVETLRARASSWGAGSAKTA